MIPSDFRPRRAAAPRPMSAKKSDSISTLGVLGGKCFPQAGVQSEKMENRTSMGVLSALTLKPRGRTPKSSLRRNRRKGGFGVRRNERRKATVMLFSVIDVEILSLLRWCCNILPAALKEAVPEDALQNLISAGLVRKHQSSGSLTLTGKGHDCLEAAGVQYPRRTALSYRGDLIHRRVHISNAILTAYQANVHIFTAKLTELSESPVLFIPAVCRGRERNLWGSSRIAAIVRLGELACGLYSVYPGAGKINPDDELKTFSNSLAGQKGVLPAFLFAGDTYAALLQELDAAGEPDSCRLVHYGEAWRSLPLPVHLLACDAVGARQLRIMAQPDYRAKLTRAALGAGYAPAPGALPSCDGLFRGVPFVMAADMDLRRLEAACIEASREGFGEITAAALKGQVQSVLRERYRGRVRMFALTDNTLKAAFGDTLPLRTPNRSPYFTAKGGVLDVPLIRRH